MTIDYIQPHRIARSLAELDRAICAALVDPDNDLDPDLAWLARESMQMQLDEWVSPSAGGGRRAAP